MKISGFGMTFAAVCLTGALVLPNTVSAGPGNSKGAHHNQAMMGGKPGKPDKVDRTVTVTLKDLSFGIKDIKVKNGETIRFVIRNGTDIAHDFTIGTKAVQKAHQKEMLKMMDAMSKGGHGMKHADANAVFLKAGETKEIIWQFAKADHLEFGCNVPGHYQAGMKGHFSFVN